MSALAQCDAFGYIYDQHGDPAPDVLVTLKKVIDASGNSILLSPLTTTTDPAGSYHFTLPEDAQATIAARASGLWNCPTGRVFKVPPGPSGELIPTFLLPGSSSVVPPLVYVSDTLSLPRSSPTADGYLAAADFVRFDAHAADTAGVTTFNARAGDVLPQMNDYDEFYAAISHTHSRTEITDLGVFSTSQPGLVPQPTSADVAKVLSGAGTWITAGTGSGTGLLAGEYLATDFKASGSKLAFTGTIATGALTTLTLTVASDFVVGQGIFIGTAGPSGGALITKVDAINGAKTIITLHDAATAAVLGVNVQHDETVALQTAINSVCTAGGGTLLFPAGYYRINKGFTDFNSILKIPANPYTAPTVPIALKAKTPVGFLTYSGSVTEKGSVIIQTDLIGTAGASIISGGPYDSNAGDWRTVNNTSVWMEGLVFRSYDNPQISGIDLGGTGNFTTLRDVAVDAGVELLTGAEPTHDTFGIQVGGNGTSIASECTGVLVSNYGVGIVGSELTHFTNAVTMQCKVGLRLRAGYHLMTGRFLLWHCPTAIEVVTPTIPSVIDFDISVETAIGPPNDPAWCVPAANHEFYDPGDKAVGKIDYIAVQAETGIFQNVGFTGMSRVTQTNLGGATKFGTGAVVVPDLHATNLQANSLDIYDPDTTSMRNVSIGVDDSGGSGYRLTRVTNTSVSPGDLLTGLTSMWKLDETSGSRADSGPAGNTLSLTAGAVASGAGKISTAAHFNADANLLFVTSNAGLQTGDVDYTWACWIKLDSVAVDADFISKVGGGTDEYIIGFNATGTPANRFHFRVYGSGNYTSIYADLLGAPVAGTWYFVVCWHNSVDGTINIQVNNSVTWDSVPRALPLDISVQPLVLGSYGNALANMTAGVLDEVAFWKGRVLDATAKTRLHASGAGLPFASW